MKIRVWICALLVTCGAFSRADPLPSVASTAATEFNPWIVGLGIVCIVLAVLVILARNGKLGGASATVNTAVQKTASTIGDLKVNVTADTSAAENAMGRLKASVEAATTAFENYHKVAGTTPGTPIAATAPKAAPAHTSAPKGATVSATAAAPATGGYAVPAHLVA